MQFSTNRVHFTASSVAQFNYAKFVNKSRGTRLDVVQDIVTVLGLHDEKFTLKNNNNRNGEIITNNIPNKSSCRVLCKKIRMLEFKDPLLFEQHTFMIISVNSENYKIDYVLDIRLCKVKAFFKIKSFVEPLYKITGYKYAHNTKKYGK